MLGDGYQVRSRSLLSYEYTHLFGLVQRKPQDYDDPDQTLGPRLPRKYECPSAGVLATTRIHSTRGVCTTQSSPQNPPQEHSISTSLGYPSQWMGRIQWLSGFQDYCLILLLNVSCSRISNTITGPVLDNFDEIKSCASSTHSFPFGLFAFNTFVRSLSPQNFSRAKRVYSSLP